MYYCQKFHQGVLSQSSYLQYIKAMNNQAAHTPRQVRPESRNLHLNNVPKWLHQSLRIGAARRDKTLKQHAIALLSAAVLTEDAAPDAPLDALGQVIVRK